MARVWGQTRHLIKGREALTTDSAPQETPPGCVLHDTPLSGIGGTGGLVLTEALELGRVLTGCVHPALAIDTDRSVLSLGGRGAELLDRQFVGCDVARLLEDDPEFATAWRPRLNGIPLLQLETGSSHPAATLAALQVHGKKLAAANARLLGARTAGVEIWERVMARTQVQAPADLVECFGLSGHTGTTAFQHAATIRAQAAQSDPQLEPRIIGLGVGLVTSQAFRRGTPANGMWALRQIESIRQRGFNQSWNASNGCALSSRTFDLLFLYDEPDLVERGVAAEEVEYASAAFRGRAAIAMFLLTHTQLVDRVLSLRTSKGIDPEEGWLCRLRLDAIVVETERLVESAVRLAAETQVEELIEFCGEGD